MTRRAVWCSLLDPAEPFLLVARMTLVALLVMLHGDRLMLLAAAGATAVLFLEERLLRSPWPWLGMALVLGWSQWSEWWLVDDHAVGMTYWLVAIGLSRFGQQPERVLALSARLLIALLFTFAFGWKLLSSQFLAGDFFEYTLVRDPRFEPVAVMAGGADEAQLADDRDAITTFTASGEFDDTVDVVHGPRTATVAAVFTAFGLLIEGAVAIAHLLPLRGRWRVARPIALISFCLTTYAVLPIAGFGVLLLTMGAAQSSDARIRHLHVAAAALVFAWNAVLAGLIL